MAVFVKVVESGSFKKAAKALALSPSVVSHHIARLEDRVEKPLIYRNTRNLALTGDGVVFLQAAQDMLQAANTGFELISSRTKSIAGELRIALPTALSRARYFEAITEFENEYPNITLSLSFSDRFSSHIEDGYDVALVFGKIADQSLNNLLISNIKRVIIASPKYLEGKSIPESPEQLAGFDWVWLKNIKTVLDFRPDASGRKKTIVAINPRMFVDNSMASRRLVLENLGLTILPDFVAEEDIASGRVSLILPDWPLESIGLYATWPKTAMRATLTNIFVEFMAGKLGTESD
jgi:DNA-binding transcriptional LysR family regulator